MAVDSKSAAVAALRLSQALCARLCHDLGSPAGMVAGALDIVEGLGGDLNSASPDPDLQEAMSIAREGSLAVQARVRLWRAACGGDTGAMTAPALVALVSAVLEGTRVRLDDGLPPETCLAPEAAQISLVGIMLAVEALPRGGRVLLTGSGNEIVIMPEGTNARWPASLGAALAGMPIELEPRLVLAPFLVALTESEGWRVTLAFGAGEAPGPLLLTRKG